MEPWGSRLRSGVPRNKLLVPEIEEGKDFILIEHVVLSYKLIKNL